MSRIYDIIKRPIITEKTTAAGMPHRVAFEVSIDANKHQIREAVESLFEVNVVRVNTLIMRGKPKRFGRTLGRRSNWKKAVVTLKEGQTIDFYMGEDELTE